jgi:hypothetical protein
VRLCVTPAIHNIRTDGDIHRFLNLFTSACARVNLSELSTHHIKSSTEGLLLLRDKARHAVRLLNLLTRVLTNIRPITSDIGSAYTIWIGILRVSSCLIFAGISEETSPSSCGAHDE